MNKAKVIIYLAIIFFGFFGAVSSAKAAEYYVATNGTASWIQCTNISTPCSATTAMTNAVAGDTVYFRAGIYEPGTVSTYEIPALNPSNSGTAGNPITFKAYPGETATINDATGGAAIGAYYRNYIVWDGFRLDRDKDTGYGASAIVRIEASSNITIQNCELIGRPHKDSLNGTLITITSGSYITIYNNKLHGMTDDTSISTAKVNTAGMWVFDAHHIYIYNNDIYDNVMGVAMKVNPNYVNIYNNHFYNCSITAVKVSPQISGDTDFIIYQNVVRNCAEFVEATDVMANPYYNLKVYNNTVYSSGTFIGVNIGSYGYQYSRQAEVYNNIFYSGTSGSHFLQYYSGASFPAYSDNNLFYGTGSWMLNYQIYYNTLSAWRTASGVDMQSIVNDPLFVNVGGINPADYKLQSNSPVRTGGRGGSYSNVLGAYLTGNEIIGYTTTITADTTPPFAPSGVVVQ